MLKSIIRTLLQKFIADYYGSSITDERHFALYIKDTIDDEDAGDGTTMRRWYATMVANGTMVDWEDVI